MKRNWTLLCAASTLPFFLSAACGEAVGGDPNETLVTAKGAALHQASGCGDLLSQIQADAIAKLDAQVARYEGYLSEGYAKGGEPRDEGDAIAIDDLGGDSAGDGDWGDGDSGDGDGDANFDADDGETAAPTVSGSGDEQGGGAEPADPSSHSETNTQVEDVDEADIVKIGDDGKRLFIVHGSEFKIVDSWPAEETAEKGHATVEGSPYELFVRGDRAVVFSHVNPDGVPEKGQDACDDCCSYQSFVQVSSFDVSGDEPQLTREMIFEGDYVSSRRYDDDVRLVVRGGFEANDLYYPDIDSYDSFGRLKSEERLSQDLATWRDQVAQDIRSTELSDWVPRAYEKDGDSWKELSSDCEGYFVPEPGLVEGGVTRVVTFDMTADDAPHMTSVLGGSSTVYSSKEMLVVTQENWMWDEFGDGDGARTSVHAFAIDGATTQYDASGFAPGYLINQFAIHEKDGVVFLSTTEEDWDSRRETKNTIVTLKENDDSGVLEMLDRSAPMGEPGETIFATRFLGDRAYVVTFLQTDPLYAVDISDPADIQVLGELHIPGFSDYIHPLEDHHLLTIGQNTGGGVFEGDILVDIDEDAFWEPTDEGVALQIFDVRDPSAPKLVHKELFGGFSYSEANHNHKAFTFVDDYFDSDESLLAFPLVTYEPDYRVGLEVLKVSKEDGFDRLGTIDHRALLSSDCGQDQYCPDRYYYGEEMRRGLQIDEYIYALSQGGLTVHSLDALDDAPVATVTFDAPEYDDGYCGKYYDDWDDEWEEDEWIGDGDTGDGDVDVPPPLPPIGIGGAAGD